MRTSRSMSCTLDWVMPAWPAFPDQAREFVGKCGCHKSKTLKEASKSGQFYLLGGRQRPQGLRLRCAAGSASDMMATMALHPHFSAPTSVWTLAPAGMATLAYLLAAFSAQRAGQARTSLYTAWGLHLLSLVAGVFNTPPILVLPRRCPLPPG